MGWKMITNREPEDMECLSVPYLEQYFAALVLELNFRLLCDKSMEEEKLLWVEDIAITAYEGKKQAAPFYRIRNRAGHIWDSLLKMCGSRQYAQANQKLALSTSLGSLLAEIERTIKRKEGRGLCQLHHNLPDWI